MLLKRNYTYIVATIGYFLLFMMFCSSYAFAKPQEIIFWHSMAGQLGDEVNAIAEQFNLSQTDYIVKPVYKGDYIESLTSFAASFRAKHPPNLIQVFEVGTPIMMYPKGITKSIDVLMKEQGIPFSKVQFLSAVRKNYSANGELMAMPFNISIPVMYYNADVLKSLGVMPEHFPKTWNQLEVLLKRIKKAGYSCGYTTAYPAWILIESYSALNGLTLSERREEDLTTHIKRLRRWQLQHYFAYGGRVDDATVLFTSARCPLFSQSSGAYASLTQFVSFHLGVAPIPMDNRVSETRHNNVIGGAAIWVVDGQSSEMDRGIAQFLSFLAEPKIQQRWYEHTGYLPLFLRTNLKNEGDWPHSILDIARLDLGGDSDLPQGHEQIPRNQIRTIYDEMLEAIFSGILTPEEANLKARSRIQHVIARFQNNT